MRLKSNPSIVGLAGGILFAMIGTARLGAQDVLPPQATPVMHAALLAATDVTADRMQQLGARGFTSIVVLLQSDSDEAVQRERQAAARVSDSEFDLYYWIEVARCPQLADEHPEWMASLQGHAEWRRLFKDAPVPAADEVVKTYPWVPILSQETYAAQLLRVQRMLAGMPQPEGVFLNDLQGGPSACGCGNPLCRWTSDYGDKRSTTPLKSDAAARFVAEVRQGVGKAVVIPVWTTECEEHDGAADGWCAGVGCFKGICWKAYTEQLMPLAREAERLGVLVPFREFPRDLARYGEKGAWIRHAIGSFETMLPRHGGSAVSASRLIAVLQGWDVEPAEIDAQIRVATQAGAGGCVVAITRLDQSWQPRLTKWRR